MTAHKKNSQLTSLLIRSIGDSISFMSESRRVCIINYHRILEHQDPFLEPEPDIKTFSWQMEALASCFNVMSLHDAVVAIHENRVPPRAVCITFDDGYRSTHDLALPVLTRLGLPATVFVTTGFLDGGNMWNDRIIEAVRLLPDGIVDLHIFGLGVYTLHGLDDRKKIAAIINTECKYLLPEGRLQVIEFLEKLAGKITVSDLMLTRAMIANLSNNGVEIGGHTVTHPILARLHDDAARYEIVENKRMLEDIIGKPVRLFAYPNGKLGMDFDQRHVHMVQAAGYFAAFTTAVGAATKKNERFQLPRGRPWDSTPFWFCMRLLGWLAGTDGGQIVSRGINSANSEENELIKKNILLVAFHFPPQSGSSGVQRTLSFSKNLHEQNWRPNVLSAHPKAYEQTNFSQLAQLPKNVNVRRAWALDAKRHLGLSGRYPELIALPDRWVSWWFCAVPLGLSMIYRNKTQVIWTTYPIATAHLIGLTLKFITGKAWVADFRDPMTQDDYPSSKWQRQIFRWIEKKTISRCDVAVFTTDSARDTYAQRYSHIAQKKFQVIENGYDEDGFNGHERSHAKGALRQDQQIKLLHSGVLYSEGRDPTHFFAAIAVLKQLGVATGDTLRIVLRAPGEMNYFKDLIAQHQIGDIVFVEPPIPYHEALTEMLSADGLLVFQGALFNTQIPAKIYEYFRARKPIFGLIDLQGETARVLTKAGFSNIADMNSTEEITKTLDVLLFQIRAGQAYVATEELVAASSRTHRARQLAQILDQISNDSI